MSLPPHPIVERWFVELTVKQIRRGVHGSTRELVDAIRHYLAVTNETACARHGAAMVGDELARSPGARYRGQNRGLLRADSTRIS